MSGPLSTLAEHFRRVASVPEDVVEEARTNGLVAWSPAAANEAVVEEFLVRYGARASPGGVVFLAGTPGLRAAESTGLPLVDARVARDVLDLSKVSGDTLDVSAQRFWSVLTDVRARVAAPWEPFFATAQVLDVCPYAFTSADRRPAPLPRALPVELPRAYEAGLAELARVLRALRPTTLVALGELAYAAVSDLAGNRRALLGAAGLDYSAFVLSRTWGAPGAPYPWADLGSFRARVVPLGEPRSALFPHAAVSLAGLAADCWT
ncbi:MAG TPA: hypothetical protein VM889_12605 [Candidatus Thermoplasmatota archaeon]|nr:hypothetical protein [Candidatus Thermoplasmatota archaeon]